MFRLISQIFTLLTPSQHRRFYKIQILVVLMAIVEMLGVASIIPFMVLVGDMNQLTKNPIIFKFINLLVLALTQSLCLC